MKNVAGPAVSQGQQYLAIPGPSVMPERVLRAMHRSAPNIYEGDLVDLTHGLMPDLRAVAQTEHNVAIYIGNGHAAWEAALANTVAAGEEVLVPSSGRFGIGWADMAEGLGIRTRMLDFGNHAGWDMERIARALSEDTDHAIKAVLAVHVDTSSSYRNDIKGLRELLDDLGHPALLMADCIASMGCDRFEMDAWGADVAVTASQKGLMVPPGLAFVFFNPKAAAVRNAMAQVSRYWDWAPRANPGFYAAHFCGTAPTHHLYGLREALDMIREEGLEQIWSRHARLARAIWAACDVWGREGPLRMNVADESQRSHAVTALRLDTPDGTRLRAWVDQNLGLTLGIGLGMSTPEDPDGLGFFRFGHMGHINGQMIMGLLGGVETGLTALNIPHGAGAVDAAARVLAGK